MAIEDVLIGFDEASIFSTVKAPSSALMVDTTRQTTLFTNTFGADQLAFTFPEYSELARKGMVYSCSNTAVVTFGTALTLTGVTYHLLNPIGSTVDLHIIAGGVSVRTCTTAGTIVWAQNAPSFTVASGGTLLTPMNKFGSSGVAIAQTATCTLPAIPTAVRVLAGSGVIAAAAGFQAIAPDYVGGALVVPPGAQMSLQGITIAGTGIFNMVWAEIPI